MLVLGVILLLAGDPATDRARVRSSPVEMTAKTGLSIDLKRRVGVARGDVLIKRDDVLVCCDEAEAEYAGNTIDRITCRGRVVIVRPGGTRATADIAVFVAVEDRITLSGGARVVSAEADLAGDRMIYDIANDRLEVEGGRTRSRFKFSPQKNPQPEGGPPERACPPGA